MKILCFCNTCVMNSGEKGLPERSVQIATQNESGMYEFTCINGHHNMIALQNDKYDVAFHDALVELKNGVTKHAVIEFSTALDTFYEFGVKMVCSIQGITQKTYEDAWKDVKSQSERQLGAYLFVYLFAFGEKAPNLSDKHRNIRNNCVHKGMIPEFEDAKSFGKNVYDIILDGIQKIKMLEEKITSEIGKFDTYVDHELKRKYTFASKGSGTRGTMSISTELTYSSADYDDFYKILERPVKEVW